MTSDFYRRIFPNTVISAQKNSVNDFMTTAQGFRMATSVNGVHTGRGADLLILDDILKPDDALSETRRRAANEWFFNTLLSRVNNKPEGQILIVMQRLHQEDLVGEVTARETWDMPALPAIAQQDEKYAIESLRRESFFIRKQGEALHPERDSLETYQGIRETIGDYHFQSQYQQSPVSREGGLIKREWLRYHEPEEKPERFSYILQSLDTANKDGDANDFSVCTTWGLYNNHFYLLDVFRKRLTYPVLKRAVLDLYGKFKPNKVLIEDKSSATALLQELKQAGVGRIEAYVIPPSSDKYFRAAAESIKFEEGRVLLPRQAPWLDEYVREITGFPGAKYDDQMDSTAQALWFLGEKGHSRMVWEKLGRGGPFPR
jgi:predicted phage terminase large subunit-like protein